jgi:hypothetical protein
MKKIVQKLIDLGVQDDATVTFTVADAEDVLHYTGDYLKKAVDETDFVYTVYDVLKHPAFEDNHIVEEMFGNDLLPTFDEDEHEDEQDWKDEVHDTISEVLFDSWFDYGWFNSSLRQYDHKRGRCELSCAFEIPFSEVREHQDTVWPTAKMTLQVPSFGEMEFEV